MEVISKDHEGNGKPLRSKRYTGTKICPWGGGAPSGVSDRVLHPPNPEDRIQWWGTWKPSAPLYADLADEVGHPKIQLVPSALAPSSPDPATCTCIPSRICRSPSQAARMAPRWLPKPSPDEGRSTSQDAGEMMGKPLRLILIARKAATLLRD